MAKKTLPPAPPVAQLTRDEAAATVTETGAVTGARPLINPSMAWDYTPGTVAQILTEAELGTEWGHANYFAMADRVMEREMHTAGVINGLVLAISGLPHSVVPALGDKSKRGQKLADEVAELLNPSGALRIAAPGILSSGITHGIGVASILWDHSSASIWRPAAYVQKPAHFFTFSPQDGCTPLLRSAVAGQLGTPLDPRTTLCFTPKRQSAHQIKNGIAWIACWSWIIKSIIMSDEALFIQTFGHPLVYGKYRAGTSTDDQRALLRAVQALNSSFRGVFREDMSIEVKEIARSNTDIFEQMCRYLDESMSKVIWASTLVTDSGRNGSGSLALGRVHEAAKDDVVHSYSHPWAAVLQGMVNEYVAINYGPNVTPPRVIINVDKQADMVAKAGIVKSLRDAGVPLSVPEIREMFGFREPQPGEEVAGGPAPSPSSADQNAPAKPPEQAKAAPTDTAPSQGTDTPAAAA